MPDLSKTFGRLTIPLLILLAISFSAAPAHAKYGGGTGEPNDPYLIYDANQMNAIGADSNDWDKHFILMADIDLAGFTGTSFNIIGNSTTKFTGVFDGNGKKISNFTYTSTATNYIGLFGYVFGEIKNLGLIDPNVDAETGRDVGLLTGRLSQGTITNCYVEGGSVAGNDNVGGLVGAKHEATITNCYSTATVSGKDCVGGLVGINRGGITNCYSSGIISGEHYVGGLLGYNGLGTITNCYATGSVSGTYDYVGGLVGKNYYSTITDCYSTGSVSGVDYVGGLLGDNDYHGTITNCYSTGSVSGTGRAVGGLVGRNDDTITNCYSSADVSGTRYVGGLVGENRGRISNCWASGTVSGRWYIGELVGYNRSTITNCYASGSVSGSWTIGGLVGRNRGTISNCYSSAQASGNSIVGGLVGNNPDGVIINCYSTGMVVGNRYVGGLVGLGGNTINCFWDIENSGQSSSDGGTGKTTAEMKLASTFFGWNGCGEILWTLDEGNDYPRLLWEGKPGQPLREHQLSDFLEGTGTPNEPYLVYTTDQLNLIGLFVCEWDKHFLLVNDINLAQHSGTEFNLIGNPCYPFTGVFDGNEHTIHNFTWTSAERDYIGLFRNLDAAGQIKNLVMENVDVNATNGDYIGGLVGINWGTIFNCYATASVSGEYRVGGLVGENGGTITNCYSTGSVAGKYAVGGLVGYNYYGRITNCYSVGMVSGNENVGGLVGWNEEGTITDCYSTGSVAGQSYVGGLVGENNEEGAISNCYATGDVNGVEGVGGLVGGISYGEVTASFWDIETSGQSTSDGGTGLPTAEMQMQVTFTDAGWDFVGETVNGIEDIWFIPQQDYPHLWWEGMQVPMKLTPRTLNCRSYGNWVKAHLTLPEGFTVADVDSNRPAVLHSFGFESAPLYVFVNKNELVEIEAAFEREAVCSLAGDWPETLTVAGFLTDGNIFLGRSKVRRIHPGLKVIEDLASCWLQGDCVQPDFCDGIDLNRDSMVNLLDYALLLNSQVDFVSE